MRLERPDGCAGFRFRWSVGLDVGAFGCVATMFAKLAWGSGRSPVKVVMPRRAHARLAGAEWGIGIPADRSGGVWDAAPSR